MTFRTKTLYVSGARGVGEVAGDGDGNGRRQIDPNAPPSCCPHMQRFHIKWKGFSHLHNTEETYEFLRKSSFKGFKRIDNYIKQVWQRERNIMQGAYTTREDLEAFAIEKERVREVSASCLLSL